MNRDMKFLLDEFQREKERHQNFINLAGDCLKNMLDIQDEMIHLNEDEPK